MKNENKRVAKNLRKQTCYSIEKIPYIVTVFHIYGHGNHSQKDKKKEKSMQRKMQEKMQANMQTIHGKDRKNNGIQCTYV